MFIEQETEEKSRKYNTEIKNPGSNLGFSKDIQRNFYTNYGQSLKI